MGKDPREFCIMSEEFVDDGSGKVKGINTLRVEWTKSPSGGWDMKKLEGSQQFFPADLVLLSMGFLGPEARILGDEVEKDARKNVKTPPGGWDNAPAQATTTKPAVKPAASKRAAAPAPILAM